MKTNEAIGSTRSVGHIEAPEESLSLSLLTSVVDCQRTYVFNGSVLISDVPVGFLFETHGTAGPFELHRMFALGWWAGLYCAGHLGI